MEVSEKQEEYEKEMREQAIELENKIDDFIKKFRGYRK